MENEKFKVTHLISFLIFSAIIIIPTIIASKVGVTKEISFNFISIVIMIILGVIGAASMVVPGVSGSMILMMLRLL